MNQYCTALECVMLDPVGLLLLPAPDTDPHGNEDIRMIPQKLMRRMMLSGIWQRYERGHTSSLEAAASEVAELPFVTRWWRSKAAPHSAASGALAQTIARCILHNLTHLREVPAMSKLLDTLREQLHVRLVCASNATNKELRVLQSRFPTLFAKFDTVVISGEEGVGKPSQRFMQVALERAGIRHAHHSVYLDAYDMQSIVAARSLGMHAILLPPHLLDCVSSHPAFHAASADDQLAQKHLANIMNMIQKHLANKVQHFHITNSLSIACCGDSITMIDDANHDSDLSTSVQKFLLRMGNCEGAPDGQLPAAQSRKSDFYSSLTSEGIRIRDNFAQFMIADVLNDPRFLPMQSVPTDGLLCFVDRASLSVGKIGTFTDASTFKDIPDDLDTTSIGLSVLHKFGKVSMETINKVLDKMLEYLSRDDGVLQVYFDPERPRIDPVVVTNAVYLFHLANRGQEVEASEKFVQSVLLHRAYEDGTLYYNFGEAFLLHVARLVHRFKEHFIRSGMSSLLAARLREHRASRSWQNIRGGDALALAMSMRAYSLCGLVEEDLVLKEKERQELVRLEGANGCWDCHPYYRYGGNLDSWIGNEGVTTAYALVALNPCFTHRQS